MSIGEFYNKKGWTSVVTAGVKNLGTGAILGETVEELCLFERRKSDKKFGGEEGL